MYNILSNSYNRELKATRVDLSSLGISDVKRGSGHGICAYTIDHVCTPEECAALIELSESNGYNPAMMDVGKGQQLITDLRKSSRYMRDDKKLADALWSRVRHLVPDQWEDYSSVGLNERFRFLRYDPGDYFKPHGDGNYQRPDGSETSFLSFQLYLNDDFVGGETAFLYHNKKVKVAPKTGRILFFEHSLFHEGALVESGKKYLIRTDVMYETDKHVIAISSK
ncbi:6301_t:CDS:1 [Acaulospora colombiana]|uniref:6301_t:CDS:1 n=1 Tax=Acaulospora colombiana TaxID=27376 RepID=A0ACA9L6E4_9GLOM|nr:6301_t:CDS:1 [Acaulospora colombiana]